MTITVQELQSYQPDYYFDFLEMQELLVAYADQLEAVRKGIEKVQDNYFVSTLDTDGIERWRSILNLAFPAGLTNEGKISVILSTLLGIRKLNATAIKEIARSYQNGEVEVYYLSYENNLFNTDYTTWTYETGASHVGNVITLTKDNVGNPNPAVSASSPVITDNTLIDGAIYTIFYEIESSSLTTGSLFIRKPRARINPVDTISLIKSGFYLTTFEYEEASTNESVIRFALLNDGQNGESVVIKNLVLAFGDWSFLNPRFYNFPATGIITSEIIIEYISELGQPAELTSFQNLINKLKPAHLGAVFYFRYNTHETLAGFTHGQLGAFTHNDLRSSVLT